MSLGSEEQRRLWDAVEWADVPESARLFIDFIEARAEAAERRIAKADAALAAHSGEQDA